jgi:hypothetical protein
MKNITSEAEYFLGFITTQNVVTLVGPQAHTFVMLLLLIVGNYKLRDCNNIKWHDIHNKFREHQ